MFIIFNVCLIYFYFDSLNMKLFNLSFRENIVNEQSNKLKLEKHLINL